MVVALEWAVAKRDDAWTIEREMSATTLEVLHSFLLSYSRVHGAKNVGKPIHIERPWERDVKPAFISPGAFAAMVGGGRG